MSRRTQLVFGVLDLVVAALVLGGVYGALPTRWAPVDVTATAVALLQLAAGVALLARHRAAASIARVASFVSLGVGLLLITLLAVTASYLSGIYGPVGKGGAVILVLVAALALPYLVAIPAVELVMVGPWSRAAVAPDAAPPDDTQRPASEGSEKAS